MKLLSWMHRKVMLNSTEQTKNSVLGNSSCCLSLQTTEQNYYVEPSKTLSYSNFKNQKSLTRFEADKAEVLFNEEAFEPFDFLAIGTFGLELLNTDPPTPTLPKPFENVSSEHCDATENDLALLSYELDKFLEAEEKESGDDTSERNSHASVITLSSKMIDGADSDQDHMSAFACPLQSYLFANSVEMANPDQQVKKERTSLEELFKRNNIFGGDPINDYHDKVGQHTKKKNLVHFMKKVMKKCHSSSSGGNASSKTDNATSMSIKRKLYKALKMFQHKVHPEEKTEKHLSELQKGKKKDKASSTRYLIEEENEIGEFARAANKKNDEHNTEVSPIDISIGVPGVDEGHWIKTDSDYLVLEL